MDLFLLSELDQASWVLGFLFAYVGPLDSWTLLLYGVDGHKHRSFSQRAVPLSPNALERGMPIGEDTSEG